MRRSPDERHYVDDGCRCLAHRRRNGDRRGNQRGGKRQGERQRKAAETRHDARKRTQTHLHHERHADRRRSHAQRNRYERRRKCRSISVPRRFKRRRTQRQSLETLGETQQCEAVGSREKERTGKGNRSKLWAKPSNARR